MVNMIAKMFNDCKTKELDMNTGRYSKLLEDLKQCTELVHCDIDKIVIELSKREKKH